MAKKQLISALQNVGNDTSAYLKINLASDTTQQLEATIADHAGQQKGYDKTVFEPPESKGDGSKKIKRTPFIKKLKRAMAILLVTILAIFSFTGWKIYEKGLTYQEVKQHAIKVKDDPAAVADQLITLVIEKSKDISISLYEQFIALVKEKWEDVSSSSPDQETTVAKEKSKTVPASSSEPKSTEVEMSQSSKHKSKK